jgi:hypothetical protein
MSANILQFSRMNMTIPENNASFAPDPASLPDQSGASGVVLGELFKLGRDLYTGKRPVGGYESEGWKEFLRLFFMDPKTAEKLAPETLECFRREVLDLDTQLAKQIAEAQEQGAEWQRQGAKVRALQLIGKREPRVFSKVNGILEKLTFKEDGVLREILRRCEDKVDRDAKLEGQTLSGLLRRYNEDRERESQKNKEEIAMSNRFTPIAIVAIFFIFVLCINGSEEHDLFSGRLGFAGPLGIAGVLLCWFFFGKWISKKLPKHTRLWIRRLCDIYLAVACFLFFHT